MMTDLPFHPILGAYFVLFLVLLIVFYFILHSLHMAQLQQLFVLLLSGFIQLYAGYLLFGFNQNSTIEKITGLLTLIPTFMDLKGNLEMAMASRVSTIANTTQHMKTLSSTWVIMLQNIILIQCQATIMTLVAIVTTMGAVCTYDNQVTLDRVITLCAIGLVTSSITCTVLGSVVTLVISGISRSGYDPDDMATSLAASIGDLITITLIGFLAQLVATLDSQMTQILSWTVTIVFFLIFPLLMYHLLKDKENLSKFKHSMPSVTMATLISLLSGIIFESVNGDFKQITLISPMFAGFVGNSIAIISSLLSTTTHQIAAMPEAIRPTVGWTVTPAEVFIQNDLSRKISMTCRSHVLHVVVPCQFIYLLALRTFAGDDLLVMTTSFTVLYLLSSVALLILMIYLTCNLVHISWNLGWDPDEAVIPITTSIGDFFGSIFLMIFYKTLRWCDDPNAGLKPG